jgi:hypothetical protein
LLFCMKKQLQLLKSNISEVPCVSDQQTLAMEGTFRITVNTRSVYAIF